MNEEHRQSIREQVLSTIESGKVKMRPKWHFVLKTILGIAGLVFVLLVVVYLISLAHFVLVQSGAWFVPPLGMRGIISFITSLPWFILLVALVFIGILEILVRKYAFAYKRPLSYSVLGLLVVVLIGGGIMANTSFHRGLAQSAEDGRLPLAGPMYRQVNRAHVDDIHPGVITEFIDTGLRMRTDDGTVLAVLIGKQTRIFTPVPLRIDDMIIVLGDRDDDEIEAFGIRKADDGNVQRMHYNMKMGPGF